MMSGMSSIHPASLMSTLSSLPEDYNFHELNEQQMMRFRDLPPTRTLDPEIMRSCIPKLVPLITDESDEVWIRLSHFSIFATILGCC